MTDQLNGRDGQQEGKTDRPIACTILNTPAAEEDEVYVWVEDLGENARRGPCRWTPRPGTPPKFPEKGDEAIMQFDSRGIPWITQWWPF